MRKETVRDLKNRVIRSHIEPEFILVDEQGNVLNPEALEILERYNAYHNFPEQTFEYVEPTR